MRGGERRALVPDWERIRVLLRQQTVFWLVAAMVLYVPDLPLGEMALVIATSISMMLVIQLVHWSAALPAAVLGHATPAHVQAAVTAVQAMSARVDELLRSRDLSQSPAMRHALAQDVRDWRLAVQALFVQLADAPDGADVDSLRQRLDRKLRQAEQCTAQAMAEDPDFDAGLELNEHSYRLLGACRGLSEALVSFAHRARLLALAVLCTVVIGTWIIPA